MTRVRIVRRLRRPGIDPAAALAAAAFFESKAAALAARRGLSLPAGIDVVLHGDRASAAAHFAAMGVRGPTDVITLRYDATPLSPTRGELLVNPVEARRAAAARGAPGGPALLPGEESLAWSADAELALYLAHGFDHLAGSDDAAAADFRAMRRRELRWLAALAARSGGALPRFFVSRVRRAAVVRRSKPPETRSGPAPSERTAVDFP